MTFAVNLSRFELSKAEENTAHGAPGARSPNVARLAFLSSHTDSMNAKTMQFASLRNVNDPLKPGAFEETFRREKRVQRLMTADSAEEKKHGRHRYLPSADISSMEGGHLLEEKEKAGGGGGGGDKEKTALIGSGSAGNLAGAGHKGVDPRLIRSAYGPLMTGPASSSSPVSTLAAPSSGVAPMLRQSSHRALSADLKQGDALLPAAIRRQVSRRGNELLMTGVSQSVMSSVSGQQGEGKGGAGGDGESRRNSAGSRAGGGLANVSTATPPKTNSPVTKGRALPGEKGKGGSSNSNLTGLGARPNLMVMTSGSNGGMQREDRDVTLVKSVRFGITVSSGSTTVERLDMERGRSSLTETTPTNSLRTRPHHQRAASHGSRFRPVLTRVDSTVKEEPVHRGEGSGSQSIDSSTAALICSERSDGSTCSSAHHSPSPSLPQQAWGTP